MGLINRQKVKQFLISGCYATPEQYLRKNGVKIGKDCMISPCHLSTSEPWLIEIGDYCRIAKDTEFFTHGIIYSVRLLKDDPDLDFFGKIKIGNYVSIGEGCKILAGVTIGNNVIIAAGSVVTKSIPDGYMVGGNPIKHIGYTDEWYDKLKNGLDLGTGQWDLERKKEYLLSLPDDKFVQKPFIKPREVNQAKK